MNFYNTMGGDGKVNESTLIEYHPYGFICEERPENNKEREKKMNICPWF